MFSEITETIMANAVFLVETESQDQLVRNSFRIECTWYSQHSLTPLTFWYFHISRA